MLNVEMVNGKKVVKLNAKVFIIPNPLHQVRHYLVDRIKKDKAEFAADVCSINDAEEFDIDNDWLVQLWFHSEEVGCDNICRHGFDVLDNGEHVRVQPIMAEELPVKLFAGHKEGDTVLINVTDGEYLIEINATLEQATSRYRDFGSFDELLNMMVNKAM